MWTISVMQDMSVNVSAVGEYTPQRVLSEPVAIPWVTIRKTVNATAHSHDERYT
jgi:hypothetical protein